MAVPAVTAIAETLRELRWFLLFTLSLVVLVAIASLAAEITITETRPLASAIATAFAVGVAWLTLATLGSAPGARFRWWFLLIGRMGRAAVAFAALALALAAGAVLSYLCARSALPFQDALFLHADQLVGFDWRQWAQFVAQRPLLTWLFDRAYYTLPAQLGLVCLITALCRDRLRTAEFLWVAIVALCITCVISGLLPAVGTQAHLGLAGAVHMPDLLALRGVGPLRFDAGRLNGIVTFPSYHAALGALFIWSTRRTGIAGFAVLALNLVMIPAILTVGGHYLVDVIGGFAVVGVTILAVRFASAGDLGEDAIKDGEACRGRPQAAGVTDQKP